MKYLSRILSLVILISAVIVLTNCGGSDDPAKSEAQIQFEKLKFTWTMTSVTLNGVSTGNAAEQFEDLTLIISGSFSETGPYNYSLNADPQVDVSPWPPAGEWKFGTPVTSSIIRMDSELDPTLDDVTMTYKFSNGDKTLEVTINEYAGESFVVGRTASVDGDWVFTFNRP